MDALTEVFLHEQVSNGFNQLVIAHDLSIKRLVGYIDGEDDYYYILKDAYGSIYGYTNVSAVMPLYFLKDCTEPSVYAQIDSMATLNGVVHEVELIIKKE